MKYRDFAYPDDEGNLESTGVKEGFDMVKSIFPSVHPGMELLVSNSDLFRAVQDEQKGDDPEQITAFLRSLMMLSDEAKKVVNLVLDLPDELVEFVRTKERDRDLSKNDIREYLRFYGWSYPSISRVFAEIKNFVATF